MKKIIFVLALFLLASITQAKILDLDENNIDGEYLIQDNTTYRILSDQKLFVLYLDNGFSNYRRIVVEELNSIEEVESAIEDIKSEINELNKKIDELDDTLVSLNEEKDKALAVLDLMKKQKMVLEEYLAGLEMVKQDMENSISGSMLISPNSYRLGIIVIIILLILTVVIRGRKFLKPEKSNKKKGEVPITNESVIEKDENNPHQI